MRPLPAVLAFVLAAAASSAALGQEFQFLKQIQKNERTPMSVTSCLVQSVGTFNDLLFVHCRPRTDDPAEVRSFVYQKNPPTTDAQNILLAAKESGAPLGVLHYSEAGNAGLCDGLAGCRRAWAFELE